MNQLNYEYLRTQCPKGWQDFLKYYNDKFSKEDFLKNVSFEKIPFELQLGIFLNYFTENGVEVDICNTEFSLLVETITDTFKNYEHVISHFS